MHRGVFFGIRSDTDAVELTAAVLEGVALAFADGLDVLLEKGGSIEAISVTGGGARLPYWGQLLAAALNRPLTYRVGGEVGAASGRCPTRPPRIGRPATRADICVAPPVDRVVQPDAALPTSAPGCPPSRTFTRLYRDIQEHFRG